jgi:hypothetical protein
MEQRPVIRFFMLKGLKARAIHTELESVYGPESLAAPVVDKGRRHFQQGKIDLFDDPRSGRPLTNDVAGALGSLFEERPFSSCELLSRHFRIGTETGL